jgi:2'-5' RNA ligase
VTSSRKRLGVVLLVPPPACVEIDALRLGCDDGALGAIAAHLTLVPPVNVRADQVGAALDVVRAAAAATRPFSVTLGPPATFAPVSPVLYLSVGGAAARAVTSLRDAVFIPPLARALTHPFVPHVTLADEMPPARLDAAVTALAGYVRDITFDRVHVMEEVGRAWEPFAEVPFGAPAVVSRGPLELRLEVTSVPGPEARALGAREWPLVPGVAVRTPLTVTAWRGDEVVGTADGWTAGALGWLDGLLVSSGVRGEGIGSHVLAAFESACIERGATSLALQAVAGSDALGLYVRRGWREAVVLGGGRVLLRRDL